MPFFIFHFSFFILVGLFLFHTEVQAIYNTLSVPNNKYGIHVINESDLENASSLVNSSGGDWGYVTVVITDSERNTSKWQSIFDTMRRLHLIPLVRLATHLEGSVWAKPRQTDINEWVEFLSGLPWVTKNRYIIIGNEPNHAKEWGNTISPPEYAEFLAQFTYTLKGKSDNFFVLPAGLDSSAPNGPGTMDAAKFLRGMHASQPEIFNTIDGWTSHSYPNPGFSGSVYARGRGTLTNYRWELTYLKSLGLEKNLPIFITETGWVHNAGETKKRGFYTPEEVADLISIASERVWNDHAIVAITPFLLNYQSFPFAQFSWQKPAEASFYPQFDAYRSIPKTEGRPGLEPTHTPAPTYTPTPTLSKVLSVETEAEKETMLADIINHLKDLIARVF